MTREQDPQITRLHQRFVNGSDSAAFELDKLFRQRLCSLVDREMNRIFQKRNDPEDVVQSVLKSFYLRAADGRFELKDRNSIWALLESVARNKLRKQIAADRAGKRDVYLELNDPEDVFSSLETDAEAHTYLLAEAIEHALKSSGSPVQEIFQLQLYDYSIGEIVELVMDGLPVSYAEIFHLALQGYSKTEIAEEFGIGREAVRYKLQRIQARLRELVIKHRQQ